MIKGMLIGLIFGQVMLNISELQERRQVFTQARECADSVDKPLLVVGTPRLGFNHPCGDITIDINPDMTKYCSTEIIDVRDIPFPTRYFGAAFASHIIEHLPTIADANKALDELHRVADNVFVVSPHKMSIIAWLHPDHHLWVSQVGDGYMIEQRGRK